MVSPNFGCPPSMAAPSPPTRPPRLSRTAAQGRRARAEHLLALFAWHRDGPLVARSLGLSLDELHEQLDELKLRRKAYRLARGSESDMPAARALPGAPSGPPVRRRARPARAEPTPAPTAESAPSETDVYASISAQPAQAARRGAVNEQASELLAVLAEVGPRRGALGVRLGGPGHPLPERVLLARFRAAGLEREPRPRERDPPPPPFARHPGAAPPGAP